jgi:hypothetical protein
MGGAPKAHHFERSEKSLCFLEYHFGFFLFVGMKERIFQIST